MLEAAVSAHKLKRRPVWKKAGALVAGEPWTVLMPRCAAPDVKQTFATRGT